jgi:hypothetical protein
MGTIGLAARIAINSNRILYLTVVLESSNPAKIEEFFVESGLFGTWEFDVKHVCINHDRGVGEANQILALPGAAARSLMRPIVVIGAEVRARISRTTPQRRSRESA